MDKRPVKDKDLGQQSLENALGTSFKILKWAMIVVLIAMLFSGIFVVDQDEKAVRIRFGKIVGTGADRVLDPGVHFSWPYPLESHEKVPFRKIQSITVDSLWYRKSIDENPQNMQESLSPVEDGYSLTGDMNILHTKWTLNYRISDVVEYLTGVEDIELMLTGMLHDAVNQVSGRFLIDEAWLTNQNDFIIEVKSELNKRLSNVPCGVEIADLNLGVGGITPPPQTRAAFDQAQSASEDNARMTEDAQKEAQNRLNKAAGGKLIADRILKAIDAVKQARESNDDTVLASATEQLQTALDAARGDVATTIQEAETYRDNIVKETRADARELQEILPEFKKNPEIYIDQVYREAIASAIENVVEKWIFSSSEQSNEEIRIHISRDPDLVEQEKLEKEKEYRALR